MCRIVSVWGGPHWIEKPRYDKYLNCILSKKFPISLVVLGIIILISTGMFFLVLLFDIHSLRVYCWTYCFFTSVWTFSIMRASLSVWDGQKNINPYLQSQSQPASKCIMYSLSKVFHIGSRLTGILTTSFVKYQDEVKTILQFWYLNHLFKQGKFSLKPES